MTAICRLLAFTLLAALGATASPAGAQPPSSGGTAQAPAVAPPAASPPAPQNPAPPVGDPADIVVANRAVTSLRATWMG